MSVGYRDGAGDNPAVAYVVEPNLDAESVARLHVVSHQLGEHVCGPGVTGEFQLHFDTGVLDPMG